MALFINLHLPPSSTNHTCLTYIHSLIRQIIHSLWEWPKNTRFRISLAHISYSSLFTLASFFNTYPSYTILLSHPRHFTKNMQWLGWNTIGANYRVWWVAVNNRPEHSLSSTTPWGTIVRNFWNISDTNVCLTFSQHVSKQKAYPNYLVAHISKISQ